MWPFNKKKKTGRWSMNHPTLGTVSESDSLSDAYKATIQFLGSPLEIQIIPDDRSIEESVTFTATIVAELESLERKAMKIAIRDLRPMYNGGWNEYDVRQSDGTLNSVRNPELSESEFEEKLSLSAISVTGNQCIDFWFKNSNLFWGHKTYVTCLDGLDLSDARAELFG